MRRTKGKPDIPVKKEVNEQSREMYGVFSDPDATHKVTIPKIREPDHGRQDDNCRV